LRITRDGLKTGDAPVDTEVLENDANNQTEQAHYYDEAVVLFTMMLEHAGD
jgi:hypothetical protein